MKTRLQKLIDELLLTPNSFALRIGVSADTIYNILRGKTEVSASVIAKIMEAFPQVNKDWLLTDSGEMFREGVKPPMDSDPDEIRRLKYIIDAQFRIIDGLYKLIEKMENVQNFKKEV